MCLCVHVGLCMNNSRRALLSAEAAAPDRRWNIHGNLVDWWGTTGERERLWNCENWRRSHFKSRLYCCCPIIHHVLLTFILKGNVSGMKTTVWCGTNGDTSKKYILAIVFWFTQNITQKISCWNRKIKNPSSFNCKISLNFHCMQFTVVFCVLMGQTAVCVLLRVATLSQALLMGN